MNDKVTVVAPELIDSLHDLVSFIQNIDQVSAAVDQFKAASEAYHAERVGNEVAMSKAYLAKQETEATRDRCVGIIEQAARDQEAVDAKLAEWAFNQAKFEKDLAAFADDVAAFKAEKAAFDASIEEKLAAADKVMEEANAANADAKSIRETLDAKLKLLQA